ncbi:MAG: GNAT family N-acetyltransferase [Anaerolineaceae bacterium]|nr:GNAT family N-acetyltransferase [Anaerolineaceae bacterium]
MNIAEKSEIRPVEHSDRTQLASLIHFSTYVHRHLDWRSPLEWIGHPPFLVIESHDRLVASLACAPDLPEIAWVRVFVSGSGLAPVSAWEMLWPEVRSQLANQNVKYLAAIPIQKWFKNILESSGFEKLHNIITLAWDNFDRQFQPPTSRFQIRKMQPTDLSEIYDIDHLAFSPLWQHSKGLIELAYSQANIATVALDHSGILGYQISTATQYGAHLGRLAVRPDKQRLGVGTGLLKHLQSQFIGSTSFRISVNTHDTNHRSIGLYTKAGFRKTPEAYPVYQYSI